jgi:hypothetical protein
LTGQGFEPAVETKYSGPWFRPDGRRIGAIPSALIPPMGRGIVTYRSGYPKDILADLLAVVPGDGSGIDSDKEGRTGHMVDSSFSVIEKKISDLAGMVMALKKDKAALSEQLGKKEAEVRELLQKVTDLTEERNEIRNKVEMILARIESIEL